MQLQTQKRETTYRTPTAPITKHPRQELLNVLWAFHAFRHTPSLDWQRACLSALGATAAAACGMTHPMAADQAAALLADAGLASVLGAAVAEAEAAAAPGRSAGRRRRL
jgi:hypothetical protein